MTSLRVYLDLSNLDRPYLVDIKNIEDVLENG